MDWREVECDICKGTGFRFKNKNSGYMEDSQEMMQCNVCGGSGVLRVIHR